MNLRTVIRSDQVVQLAWCPAAVPRSGGIPINRNRETEIRPTGPPRPGDPQVVLVVRCGMAGKAFIYEAVVPGASEFNSVPPCRDRDRVSWTKIVLMGNLKSSRSRNVSGRSSTAEVTSPSNVFPIDLIHIPLGYRGISDGSGPRRRDCPPGEGRCQRSASRADPSRRTDRQHPGGYT